MTVDEGTELDLICTDLGTHTRRDLATLRHEGGRWVQVNYRRNAAGYTYGSDYKQGQLRQRADGGLIYTPPPCPSCRKALDAGIRDDTLTRYVEATRDTPLAGSMDVSLAIRR